MNDLTTLFYNVHSTKKAIKELWESLGQKYKIKDARAKESNCWLFLRL